MNELCAQICKQLETIAGFIHAQTKSDGSLTTPMSSTFGWNYPSVSIAQHGDRFRALSRRLASVDFEELGKPELDQLAALSQSLTAFSQQTQQYLFNGNLAGTSNATPALLDHAEFIINQVSGWQGVSSGQLPAKLAQRATRAKATLDRITPNLDDLQEKIKTIQSAYETAGNLPTTQQDLADAERQLRQAFNSASQDAAAINQNAKNIETISEAVLKRQAEVDEVLKKCAEALGAATTVSLAQSFKSRSEVLSSSLKWWMGLLTVALGGGAVVGVLNFNHISDLLKEATPEPWKLVTYLLLALLSVGGPIWLAWMSSKQINQRFKLAEDYAYKAAVASAYEGYKRETAAVDRTFSETLLASAMARLDENPLRYLDKSNSGSPLHDLANSSSAKKVADRIAGLIPSIGEKKDDAK